MLLSKSSDTTLDSTLNKVLDEAEILVPCQRPLMVFCLIQDIGQRAACIGG